MSWNRKKLFFEIILPFSKILENLEYEGFLIDVERLRELKSEFSAQLKQEEKEIYSIAGKEFNINSTKQLAKVLYDDLKIPNYVMDYNLEKGRWVEFKDEFFTEAEQAWNDKHDDKHKGTSTNVFALKRIRDVYKHPIIDHLLMQRRIGKILSTFVEGIFRYLTVDNKIHANFFQNTTSGRPSCSSPNLLQLPSRNEEGKKIKEVFVAPNGYVLHSADFSGLELRFLAWLSNDRVMWPAFQNGIDVHALTCSKIKNFGLTYEQAIKDREKRFVAKTTNFLICYGGSYETLQDTLLKQGDIFINKKLCSEFIDTFFQTYPDIRVLQDKVLEGLCTNGYVKNLYGRERFFPELKGIDRNNKANMKKINMAHRAAFSHFIQSSSSGDYGAYKTVQLDRLLRALNCGRFYLNFYDGYYSLVQEEKIDKFKSLAKQLLEKPEDPVSINLPVEESIGKNWGQLK